MTSPAGRCILAPVTSHANWDRAVELNVAAVSRRQQRILNALTDYIQRYGYPPSLRELAAAVGLTHWGTVAYHLHQLADRGLVELPERGAARSIRLTWGMR